MCVHITFSRVYIYVTFFFKLSIYTTKFFVTPQNHSSIQLFLKKKEVIKKNKPTCHCISKNAIEIKLRSVKQIKGKFLCFTLNQFYILKTQQRFRQQNTMNQHNYSDKVLIFNEQ